MIEKPQPDPVPVDDPPPHPAEPLQISTPVIHMQDLEHNPGPDTRVSNKGMRIEPKLGGADLRDLTIDQIEKSLSGQMPG